MIEIQTAMARRCVELLALPGPSLILDVGCGSGLSGMVLAEQGHSWIGLDISIHMLNVANERRITPKIRKALKQPRYYRPIVPVTESNKYDDSAMDIPLSQSISESESEFEFEKTERSLSPPPPPPVSKNSNHNNSNDSNNDDYRDGEVMSEMTNDYCEGRDSTLSVEDKNNGNKEDHSDDELVKYARAGDLLWGDMGHGLPFRPGCFDACISVSALQWLCNQDQKSHRPIQRINRFFQTLYACLVRGGKAVLQVYPENPHQMELLTSAAMKQGFQGGLVVDFPHSTRAKKYHHRFFTHTHTHTHTHPFNCSFSHSLTLDNVGGVSQIFPCTFCGNVTNTDNAARVRYRP
jgi:18S rRNA (guanine1575-N7)-methyltransferase